MYTYNIYYFIINILILFINIIITIYYTTILCYNSINKLYINIYIWVILLNLVHII